MAVILGQLGNIAEQGIVTDTGFKYYNRDMTAYITTGAGGFTVTGTFTTSSFGTGFTVQAATNLAKGDLVYISSVTAAGVPIVSLSKADAMGKPAQLVITDATILSGAQGTAQVSGLSAATLNTNAATVGDPVYLSTTGTTTNTWTLTDPAAAGARSQIVGRVNVKSATVGQIAYNLVGNPTVAIGLNELQASSVVATKIAAQAVTLAKLERQTDATILMGKGAGADVAANAMSGDATISSTGVLSIASGKLTPTMVKSISALVSSGAIPAGAGGIPYAITLVATDVASGNIDFTGFPFKMLVTDVIYLKTGGAGNAGNSITVHNGTTGNAITDALNSVTDTAVVHAGSLNDAYTTIAAGSTVRLVTVKAGDNNAATITLVGYIVA